MNTNALIITNAASGGPPAAPMDIRGIHPPIDVASYWFLLWVWLAAVVVLVTAVVVILWLVRRKIARPPPIPYVPPHERARQKLQEALALFDQPGPFCILVSDTVRVYLEERFNFRAPERTTEEFLHELQATDLLLPDQKGSLGEFLSVCDMVKFARYEPGPPELQALHDSATRLIDETEPQPESVTPDGEPPVPAAA